MAPVPADANLPEAIELLPGERLYKRYRVGINWSEPTAFGDYHSPGWTEGLPKDRFWNGTCLHDKMFAEEVPLEQIKADALAWFYGHVYGEKPVLNWGNLEITVRVLSDEVWCEGWFSHWTYDTFASDEEVMASFRSYVWRMQLFNERARNRGETEVSLMGAEDSWRWSGWQGKGDRGSERSPPPCRCDGCKRAGLVRVNH